MSNNTADTIEALLFAFGPMSRYELAKKIGATDEELKSGITALAARLTFGITLVDDGHILELRTAPGTSAIIERVQKEENSRDIGKAGLEALAAILYRGPLTRAEIDFIRGVNSSQTLRTLTQRGLVRRVENPKDERSFLYEPTTELLSYLGLSARSHVPEYEAVRAKLEQLEEAYRIKKSQSE
ncbi:MAG TPA: SMC-Scp complex subunit ScpB [Candidatus Paceibacterota bacterium]|nr:SMC-Scp complex subunit ScpB [Candidatus Paceibacterota bacterium]